jgi:hypothetical protein
MKNMQWLMTVSVLALAAPVFAEADNSAIDPRVVQAIKEYSDRSTSIQQARVHAIDTIDVVLDSGQKVQYEHERTLLIDRPNRMIMKSSGDVKNRQFWKDGKTITLVDDDHRIYAQLKDPGTIDDAMDLMSQKYGVTVPLADLLSSNPAEVLLSKARTGTFLGMHKVDDAVCRHIALQQDDMDWQAWVEAGDTPRLRKLIITYKKQPGAPQYTLRLKSSETLSSIPREKFKFTPPDGYDKIDFMPVKHETNAGN